MSMFKKSIVIISFLVSLFTLTACDNELTGEVLSGQELLSCDLPLVPNAGGTACVEPPALQCDPPTVPNATNDACVVGYDPAQPDPIVFAGADQAILFYNRAKLGAANSPNDPSYDGYRLHTWNNPECDAYEPESIAVAWDNGLQIDGIDPNYGAYWILELKDDRTDCGNFIIHIGTDDAGKELGGGDWKMPLSDQVNKDDIPDFSRMNWTITGFPAVFEFPITNLGPEKLQIKDARAHWLDGTTLVMNFADVIAAPDVVSAKLHFSTTDSISVDEDGNVSGTALDLFDTTLTTEQQAIDPRLNGFTAYAGDWTAADAKGVLKGHAVWVGYDANDVAIVATNIQAAKAIDALYTTGEDDADEQTLGISYDGGNINVALWAPTAQSVDLVIYREDGVAEQVLPMTENANTGVWSYAAPTSLDRRYYRFRLSLFHYATGKFETIESTDPYSVGLSMNGEYSQFVNLNDSDLFPADWQGHIVPTVADPEDAVIYEIHVRDFSANDASVSIENRGKYMAFTEMDSDPVNHLTNLTNSGLTHIHLLPVNDIATINEFENLIVDLDDTVGDLCRVNSSAPVCGAESDSAILRDVMASYGPLSEQQQELANAMRGYDSFNWGYDPKHFNVPDGIYASDPNGTARIIEFRNMVKALHDQGLRVVVDVVYNHTNSAGIFDNSVFDKVVPGYYHRRDLTSGSVTQSTCCNDTELYNTMMDKFMKDSLLLWTEQYGIDGFRFDIMSHGSKEQMLEARDLVQTVDPDNYFYGEGWYRNNGLDDTSANQENMAGTEIATFNDRLRDAVRNAALFKGDDSDGSMNAQDIVKVGMAGTLSDYILKDFNGVSTAGSSFGPSAYALDPADIINYVSKHDNETLWDKLQFELPLSTSQQDRVRIANISAAIPLMSQGIPFLQLGGDMLRSKSLDRNSYDSGDWFNHVDYTMLSNNWNVGLPLEQDNGFRWYPDGDPNTLSISELAASSNTIAYPADIQFAHEVFKEFLSIRADSKLFRLTTAQDVIDRVGFHNIGRGQQQGVIVMSIDDGVDLPDLDPANDAIVVVVNGTASEQSITVNTAAGFELHPTLQNSMDPTVASASFAEGMDEGTFTVPAHTMAVYVKPQGASQGEGLSAYATSGAPDVVPYGSTTVYVRGGMNGWGTDNPMSYEGNGIYRGVVTLDSAATTEFKIASEDWSTVDFGATDQVVVEDVDKTLERGGSNLQIQPSESGDFIVELDAADPEAPILNVRNADPFRATTIYLRGGMNGWGTGNPMAFEGAGVYKSIIDVTTTGSLEFKVASEDWSTVDLGTGEADGVVVEETPKTLATGGGNLSFDFTETGEWSFILDAAGRTQRTLSLFKTETFGGTPVFVRGGMNEWGEVDLLNYNGDSNYTVDILLVAGTYEFKVASSDWSTVNMGAVGDSNVVTVGTPYTIGTSNGNLSIEIATDGTYRFTVEGPSRISPTVTVDSL